MKFLLLSFTIALCTLTACAQGGGDKSKRPSPPATVTQTLKSGAEITVNYSQPSVKGRKIGETLEPKADKIWRTGANEATVFETSKDIKVQGKPLAAGKYGLFSLVDANGNWQVIFNKDWNQWGAYSYKADADVLRVPATVSGDKKFTEKFTILIDKDGTAHLLWGDYNITFTLE